MMNSMRSVGNAVVREKRYLSGWNVAWVCRPRRKVNSYEEKVRRMRGEPRNLFDSRDRQTFRNTQSLSFALVLI